MGKSNEKHYELHLDELARLKNMLNSKNAYVANTNFDVFVKSLMIHGKMTRTEAFDKVNKIKG
jgi:hypothetical protein